MLIGIDFDNTLVTYDHLFAATARAQGWLSTEEPFPGKPTLRATIRSQPNGEHHWQDLQVEVYARRMAEAHLAPGADAFIHLCRTKNVPLCIISHKTRHAVRDPQQTDLRQIAWEWMTQQGFFATDGLGFQTSEVDFAATRTEKLTRLAQRGCTHFIDDLIEVLADPGFPPTTEGILYCPTGSIPEVSRWPVYRSWHDIIHHLFDD
ncbi:MAG: hypothetical protein HQL64_07730 [Magnetococcales bacterium]|nr:hypothetical protein [Magnetococcales bacterium]